MIPLQNIKLTITEEKTFMMIYFFRLRTNFSISLVVAFIIKLIVRSFVWTLMVKTTTVTEKKLR